MRRLGDLFKRKDAKGRWIPLTRGSAACTRCDWAIEGGTETQRMIAFMEHMRQEHKEPPA